MGFEQSGFMIITISGVPGSGKSTVARVVAGKMNLKHISVGDILREIARSRGMTILEISKLAEEDRKIDEELDRRQKALSRMDNLVVDSRLGFHFIPNSFKVFLDASPEEAGRRIFSAGRHMEKENITLEKTIENCKRRKRSEKIRYKKYYQVDPFEKSNYDLVVDTTSCSPEEVAERIIEKAKALCH